MTTRRIVRHSPTLLLGLLIACATPQPATPQPATPHSAVGAETPAPGVPAPEVPAPETPAREAPAAQTSAPQTPASQASAAQPHTNETQRPQVADVASPRVVEQPWMSLAEWRRRVQAQLDAADRDAAQIAFVGDSITEAWCQTSRFNAGFKTLSPLNLGIGGDQTQHVLWRLEQGVLSGPQPRWVVVMIGVNNLGNGFTPTQTAAGVAAVVRAVHKAQPQAKLALLQILPAGATADDPLRKSIASTNQQLTELAPSLDVTLLDFGSAFVEADGTIHASKMGDFLHPTSDGYDLLTRKLGASLEQLDPAITHSKKRPAPAP